MNSDDQDSTTSDAMAGALPTRRRAIKTFGGLAVAAFVPGAMRAAWGEQQGGSNPVFTLGVASGDPGSDRVVLWTRLAPDPLNGGGLNDRAARIDWEVAIDPAMTRTVRRGTTTSTARNGHAVSVHVTGLRPDSWYYYRFSHRGVQSRIGRTRTFPAAGVLPARMRFAFCSCQHYEQGYYAAYRDMATQDLDFVVHVGDYIYEYAASANVPAARRHQGGEIATLADYRNRYALYRLDRHLQDTHAAFPFIVTFDDHEVDNNYAGLIPEDEQTAEAFRQRRRNAYQVYRESMPLRANVQASGDGLNLYRRLPYGRLADILVLDTRQYRSDQPCDDGLQFLQTCPAILSPDATMLGATQEAWLFDQLRQSRATWNVLAQQVMMMRWDLGALTGQPLNYYNVDAWDGYQAQRDRILRFLAEQRVANPVVLTGDIHSAWAADLKADFNGASSPVIGAEFVCTSISSGFGDSNDPLVKATLPSNPHIRYFDGLLRGYSICTVTPGAWRTDFRAVQRVADPVFTVPSADLPVSDVAAFNLIAGQAGLTRVL